MDCFNSVSNTGNLSFKHNSYRYGDKQIKPIYFESGSSIAAYSMVTGDSYVGLGAMLAPNPCLSGRSEDFSIHDDLSAVFNRKSNKC